MVSQGKGFRTESTSVRKQHSAVLLSKFTLDLTPETYEELARLGLSSEDVRRGAHDLIASGKAYATQRGGVECLTRI